MLETFNTSAQFTADSPPIHVASVLDSNTGSGERHEAGANAAPAPQQVRSIFNAMDALGVAREKYAQFLALIESLKSEKK